MASATNHKAASYSDHAAVSAAAYGDTSYLPGNLQKDEELSNRNRVVYFDPNTRKAIVGFKGTDPSVADDLGTDALVAAGLYGVGSRFKNALETTRRAQAKYRGGVSVTGHSLGGTQALYVSRQLDVDAYAFNPGASVPLLADGYYRNTTLPGFLAPRRKANPRATVITTGVDPISFGYVLSGEKKVYVAPHTADVHGLANFLVAPLAKTNGPPESVSEPKPAATRAKRGRDGIASAGVPGCAKCRRIKSENPSAVCHC
jgi:hypothetical protein